MLACISAKSLEEAIESSYAPKSRADPRRLKSFTSQLKELAVKFSLGAYRHSCRPCSASVYDHDTAHAVHPVTTLDAASEIQSGQFSLPTDHYRAATPSKEIDFDREYGQGFTPSVHIARLDQKFTKCSSTVGQPQIYNNELLDEAVKGSDVSKVSSGITAAGECDPGTEWFSQIELGVFITFVALPNGCNGLKRIRFSRDIFTKKEAEAWWAENGNRVRAVYNVPAFERPAATDLPTSSSEEEASGYATPAYSPGVSCGTSMRDTSAGANLHGDSAYDERLPQAEAQGCEGDSEQACGEGEQSTWVEEDVPGVYLTVISLPEGGRELKRVRFSREKFTEKQAKIWWDDNRGRIHKQYL